MTEETMLRDPGPQQIEPLAEAAPGTRCTLMKLTRRTSRWPIGDPEGLLLLRRYLCAGTAVLRVSSRGRISCAGTAKVTEAKPRTERVPLRERQELAAAKARIQEMGDKDNAFKPFASWKSRTPTFDDLRERMAALIRDLPRA